MEFYLLNYFKPGRTKVTRLAVLEFLSTLVLFPPEATASNLNPGDPAGSSISGSLNLGALFQIEPEGPE